MNKISLPLFQQVFRLGEEEYFIVNNHFSRITRFSDAVSNNINAVIKEAEAVSEFDIRVAVGFFKLLILRINKDEKLRSQYIIILFQQLSNNNLIFVMWRDINFRVQNLHLYNKKGMTKKANYLYHGVYVEVNPAYGNQDISLFSYYIYALILYSVEKIDDFRVKSRVYLQAQNWSTVSEKTSHTKCPYCFYFNEVYALRPNRNKSDPKNIEAFNSGANVPFLYLNPEKRVQRDFIYKGPVDRKSKNICPLIEEKIDLGGKHYISSPTREHIHLENESPFINKVMRIYENKKSRHHKQSLGIQLITACIAPNLRKLLKTSNLTHNYKPLANALHLRPVSKMIESKI